MLIWPTVAVLGFFAMAGLVVLLGTSSTARYEFERNRVQGQREQAAAPVAAAAEQPAPEQPAAEQLVVAAPAADTGEAVAEQVAPSNVAVLSPAHPAGRRRAETVGATGWWLVEACDGQPGTQVLAGPFADQVEADWAALAAGAGTPSVVVHGVRRADGNGVVRRQTPEERAWLADLGDQLDRLPAEWDDRLDEDDALATLVVEIAAALVEAGLPLHDCAGDAPAGGVCLTPAPDGAGVLVSWQQHDRMSRLQVRGPEPVTAVQQTMNAAIAGCLSELGFDVEPIGPTGCPFVPATQEWC